MVRWKRPTEAPDESDTWRDEVVYFVWFVLGAVVLFLTAQPVNETDVGGVETTVFEAINGLPGFLYPVVWVFMQLGNIVAVPIVALVWAIMRRYRTAIKTLAAGLLVWLLAKYIKTVVVRGRPGELLEDVILHGAPASGQGYVSGHAAVAAAIATVATHYLDARGRIIAWSLAALVSFGRVYTGAHLPLDVIGGAALGVAGGAAVLILMSFVPGHPTRRSATPEKV